MHLTLKKFTLCATFVILYSCPPTMARDINKDIGCTPLKENPSLLETTAYALCKYPDDSNPEHVEQRRILELKTVCDMRDAGLPQGQIRNAVDQANRDNCLKSNQLQLKKEFQR